jgi:NitT/TauT family transport system substrate-binding protein
MAAAVEPRGLIGGRKEQSMKRPAWGIRGFVSELTLLGIVVSTIACRGDASSSNMVKIAMAPAYHANLPTLVAYAKGYFRDEKLDVADFIYGSGPTLRNAITAKEVDFVLTGFVIVGTARIAGSSLKAILTANEHYTSSLLVLTELKDTVHTVADLRGKKVGFSSPGSTQWFLANIFLKKAGLDPDKDVELVALGEDPRVWYMALKTRKVDALVTAEPAITHLMDEGLAYPIVKLWEDADYHRWVADKTLAYVLVTREDVTRTNPELVKRVVRAHQKALAFIRSESTSKLADVVLSNPVTASRFEGLNREQLIQVLERTKPGIGDGCLTRAGFEIENQMAADYKIVRRKISFEEFADVTFAGACP